MLTLVPKIREPWNQQPGEPEEAFGLFLRWLMSEPREAPSAKQTAELYNWAERARLFDARFEAPRSEDALAETLENLKQLIALESRKAVKGARLQEGATMTHGDLLRMYQAITGQPVAPGNEDFDASKLSAEDVATYMALYKKATARAS